MRRSNDSQTCWIKTYERKGVFWVHDGNPKRPHALLTSGNHSDGFFWSGPVVDDDVAREAAVEEIIDFLEEQGVGIFDFDRVIGPATGATRLAEEMAFQVTERRWTKDKDAEPCRWSSPKKLGDGSSKTIVLAEGDVRPGERVLLIEDVITTGGSVEANAEIIIAAGATVLPVLVALVNRSGLEKIAERRILALIDRPMPMWAPEDCLLCKAGSEAIRPKKPVENWDRLTAQY
ncbi:MAG: phosphoribosyltransferase family protein [Candidatus Paceibacterota bacterium]|jgi:orotate phosphoribosyltransferase